MVYVGRVARPTDLRVPPQAGFAWVGLSGYFDSRHNSHLLPLSCGPLGLNLYDAFFAGEMVTKTTPYLTGLGCR